MDYTVALFGEAEKGRFKTAYHCTDLSDLAVHLGEPTEEGKGLNFAIQSLLYNCDVIFFRVEEEGFSVDDYLFGLNFLKSEGQLPKIAALGMPGVGDHALLNATQPICHLYNSLLILTQSDLYDFLTAK